MTRRIQILAKPTEQITVDLIGKEYVIKPPKATLGLAIAEAGRTAEQDPGPLLERVDDWINAAFGEKNGKAVIARLASPKDDLDLPHIMELMRLLTEETTGDPIT
jgi:hypothetical protein